MLMKMSIYLVGNKKRNVMNKKIMMVLTTCLFVGGISQAKMKSINSRRDFEQSVAKDSMVVALFYNEKDKGLTQMYEDVSKVQKYDDADILFLRVNMARPELNQLARLYNVETMPTIIFFHKGKQLHDVKGRATTQLFGNISRSDLQTSIDAHFGAEMEQYIAGKNAKVSNRVAREKESWKAYYYPRNVFTNSYGPEERDLE
jgi:thioredoxin-like negative regulator of GroEL